MDLLTNRENIEVHRLIVIARRYQHAIYAQIGNQRTEFLDFFHASFFAHSRIRRDMIAESFSFLDHRDGFVENTVAVADIVMGGTHPIEVYVQSQALMGRNLAVDLRVQQQGVRTKINMAPASEHAFNQLFQLRINGWLSSANREHWRATLVNCLKTFLQR